VTVHNFLEWLGSTPWSIQLLESQYAWPLLESTHVLTLALFMGTAAVNDLRLLGVGFTRVPAAEVTMQLLRITRLAFAVMVVTGLLIFYSNPVHYYHNIFFRIKAILLVVAGVNIALFHGRIHRSVREWEHAPRPPRAARLAGAISLVAWAGIIICGRLIAYNWFDCDKPPLPAAIAWASQCPAAPEQD
jgi:cytochrome c biogenesis protein CcdA